MAPESIPVADLTPDEVIAKAWEIAGNDECDGVTWTAGGDQWWQVSASCLHGKFSGTSKGPMDVSRAFTRTLEKFTEAHPDHSQP